MRDCGKILFIKSFYEKYSMADDWEKSTQLPSAIGLSPSRGVAALNVWLVSYPVMRTTNYGLQYDEEPSRAITKQLALLVLTRGRHLLVRIVDMTLQGSPVVIEIY